MIGRLLQGEAKALDWLTLSPEERLIVERMIGFSSFSLFSAWDELPYNHNRKWAPEASYYKTLHDAVENFAQQDDIASKEDLSLIASAKHPYYSNEGATDSERLSIFFSELSEGIVVPSRVFSKWLEVLEEANGNSLKACILAEFHRPIKAEAS